MIRLPTERNIDADCLSATFLDFLRPDPGRRRRPDDPPRRDDAAEAVDDPGRAAEGRDPSRRVPNHFGQIGLTIEQREAIYKIRKTHQEKVDALKAQIAEAEAKSMSECESVLNETQRKLLENLRASGSKAAKPVETARAPK